jgi:hypothetical protein
MILEKDKKKWKTIFDGSTRDFRINGLSIGNSGIFTILFQLEDEKIRNNFLKKAKIKELKNRIKEDTKRLQLLRKVKQ